MQVIKDNYHEGADGKGFMEDAQGRLVPVALVKDYDKLKDELITELARKGLALQEEMRRYKALAMGEIEALVQVAGEKYEVKLGGKKGNISLVSHDGRIKIVRAVSERIQFGEELQAAKELVDQCLRDWTEGSREELLAIINDAFQVDKEGRINTARILSLRKLNISDPRWLKAMTAITDSISVAGTSTYFRIYLRDENGKYQQVPLDLSAL